MSTTTIFHVSLVLHIIGITIMAGTTLADAITYRQFWKYLQFDKQKAILINSVSAKFPRFIGIGAGLLILSGVSMVASLHGVVAEQLWFRIKMSLVLLAILNGLLVARPQALKLKKMLASDLISNNSNEFSMIKKRITVIIAIQIVLLLVIFILSVFRFN
jgi:uncharacterized membrane protein